MTIEIVCPSGLKGTVRGLSGADGKFLSDNNLAKRGLLMNQILSTCWVETLDSGIYTPKPDGSVDWLKALQGDRFYALIQIAIAGKGNSDYEFPVQCRNTNCREKFNWEIDLDLLPVKTLPESSRETLQSGGVFECIMPGTEARRSLEPPSEDDALALATVHRRPKYEIVPGTGTMVKFRLPTGQDELRGLKIAKKEKLNRKQRRARGEESEDVNPLVQGLLMRIEDIAGVEKSNGAWIQFFEAQPIPMLMELLNRFDVYDCGIETQVEIECPDCDEVMVIDLPLDETLFFGKRRRSTLTEN